MDFYEYRKRCAKYLMDNDLPISFEILPEKYGDFIGGCFKPWKVVLDYERCVEHHQKELIKRVFANKVTLIDAAKLTSEFLIEEAFQNQEYISQNEKNYALAKLDIESEEYQHCLSLLLAHGARFVDSNNKNLESLSTAIYYLLNKK